MKFQKTKSAALVILLSFACTVSCLPMSGCSTSKELENGVYYLESDRSAYLTVTDVKEESDSEGKYYKTCKIQFSDTYNIDKLKSFLVFTLSQGHAGDGVDFNDENYGDKMGENIEYYENLYENSINLKKQLVDNPCTFYVYDIVGEEHDTVYTVLEGVEEKDKYWEIILDADGALVVDSELSADRDIFRR